MSGPEGAWLVGQALFVSGDTEVGTSMHSGYLKYMMLRPHALLVCLQTQDNPAIGVYAYHTGCTTGSADIA